MPVAQGHLIRIPKITLQVMGVTVTVKGTVEVLAISKRLPDAD
jgi:hypothetical protein